MEATAVDWSMGSRADVLIDWRTAAEVGRRVAGPGPSVSAVQRAHMREDLSELVPITEGLVREFTGLSTDGSRSRAWVMSRGEWVEQNLKGIQRLLEPLAARVVKEKPRRAPFRRKTLGTEVGALLGYVSRKVLGQVDVFLPPDDEGLVYFVGPNVAEAERRFSLPPRDFRMWIALHEVCHRVQFGGAPWLRGHLQGLIDSYFSTIELDMRQVLQQLRKAIEEARKSGESLRGANAIFLLMSPPQREMFHKMQGVMALLEGHASYVMNQVAEGRVQDLGRMKRALNQRRSTSGLERSFQRAIGFESKIQQYSTGERFVAEVVERAGMEGFNLAWARPDNLPGVEEIAEPERWVSRVTGA